MSLPISVFIITKNEEKNLPRLLASLNRFDEIIVVDSGSTDNTINIAQEFGAIVYEHDWLGYSKQKAYAMSLCSHDWVINLDADEEIPNNLIDAIKLSIQDPTISAIRFLRVDYFLDKPMPTYINLPKNVRLYKKSSASFDQTCLVHESASINGKTKLIKLPFIHHGYNDLKVLISKLNLYSSLKAEEKLKKGRKYSLLKLLLIFPLEFIRKLILQRYVLFGWRGFVLAVVYANYSFLKEAKLFSGWIKKKR